MFNENFTPIPPEYWDHLESSDELEDFIKGRPLETLQPEWMPLPFYANSRLGALTATDLPPPNRLYFLMNEGDIRPLNWTNEPVYSHNDQYGMVLNLASLLEYARFFFHFIRGQLGRFLIVEHEDEIVWLPGEKNEGLKRLRDAGIQISPLRYLGPDDSGQAHKLIGYVVFKNALFQTEIVIAPHKLKLPGETGEPEDFTLGQMKLTNETVLLEELPVQIDPPPGILG